MQDLNELRSEIKKYIDNADKKTLGIVHTILEAADETDDPLMSMTPEQEASFLRGLQDAKAGRVTPHEDVMKKYEKWLTK